MMNSDVLMHQIPLLPKSLIAQPTKSIKVLVIDDDPDFADALKHVLESRRIYDVEVAGDPFEAANRLADLRFDFVIADCVLQDWNGITTLQNADHLIDVDPTVGPEWSDAHPVKVVFCSSAPMQADDLLRTRRLKHFSVVGFLPKVSGIPAICLSVEKLIHGSDRPAA